MRSKIEVLKLSLSWRLVLLAVKIYPDMENIIFAACLESFIAKSKQKTHDEVPEKMRLQIEAIFKNRAK